MNLRQVEVFCAVMRCRTTIAAAHELGISQPAVSNAIQHLEAQAGIKLFERTGKRLVPTSEARLLYRDAEPLNAMSQSVAMKMRDLRDIKRGHLRVLTTNALMRSMIASALATFLQNRPRVQVFFDMRRMEGVIEAIESGYADLGFALDPPSRPGITIEAFDVREMVVVMPRDHPLANYDVVRPEDIGRRFPIIGLESTSRLGRLVQEHFDRSGVPYLPNIEVRHCVTACTLVERNLGVAVVDPYSTKAENHWELVTRPFAPTISVSACVMHLAERPLSRMARRLVQAVKATTTQGEKAVIACTNADGS